MLTLAVDFDAVTRLQIERFEICLGNHHLPGAHFLPALLSGHNGEFLRHKIEDDIRWSVVTLGLRFLLAVRVVDETQHDTGLEWVRVFQWFECQRLARFLVEDQRRNHQLRIKPTARLVDRFGDVIGREAALKLLTALMREAELRERHAP